MKELYMKWLLELFSIEEGDDKIFFRKYGQEPEPALAEASTFTHDGRCRRPTLVSKEVAKEAERSQQEERDKELIKAYLFKRLGHMAHESGVLQKLQQDADEA